MEFRYGDIYCVNINLDGNRCIHRRKYGQYCGRHKDKYYKESLEETNRRLAKKVAQLSCKVNDNTNSIIKQMTKLTEAEKMVKKEFEGVNNDIFRLRRNQSQLQYQVTDIGKSLESICRDQEGTKLIVIGCQAVITPIIRQRPKHSFTVEEKRDQRFQKLCDARNRLLDKRLSKLRKLDGR